MKNIINTYIEEIKYDYRNKEIIDFSKYLTQDDLITLQEFDVFIEDRLYTEEEFFFIKSQIFIYLAIKNNSNKKYQRIHNLFLTMINDYNFN